MCRMQTVVSALETIGHDAYCHLFKPAGTELRKTKNYSKIFTEAFKHLESADAIAMIITSASRSVGQLMELGAGVYLKKPIFVFEHVTAKDTSYIQELATEFYSWSSMDELTNLLQNAHFSLNPQHQTVR